MKQNISIEQISELSDEQKERLREWWVPDWGDKFFLLGRTELEEDIVTGSRRNTTDMETPRYVEGTDRIFSLIDDWIFDKVDCLPLLSIGQMTHFLYEETNDWGIHYNDSGVFFTVYLSWNMETARMSGKVYSSDDLVDALWEAVKKVL